MSPIVDAISLKHSGTQLMHWIFDWRLHSRGVVYASRGVRWYGCPKFYELSSCRLGKCHTCWTNAHYLLLLLVLCVFCGTAQVCKLRCAIWLELGSGLSQEFANCACAISKLRSATCKLFSSINHSTLALSIIGFFT